MRLVRGNAWSLIENAPDDFIDFLEQQFRVPVDPGTVLGTRFGRFDYGLDERFGVMVHERKRIPAGLTMHVYVLAVHNGLACEIVDTRQKPLEQLPLHSLGGVSWRPYQDEVHEAVLRYGAGVVISPPRTGKTLMCARAIDALGQPAVYLAPTQAIVAQTTNVFRQHFGEEWVSRIDSDSKDPPERPIVVTTPNSAVKMPLEWWQSRQLLVIDEFHHSAAETLHRISVLAAHIYYRLGFTGTHFRTNGDDLAMHAVTAHVLKRIEINDMVPDYLAEPKIFFCSYKMPSRVKSTSNWDALYTEAIVRCRERNEAIINTAHELQELGQPTIVLVKRREHADKLGQQIRDSVVVKGGAQVLTSKAVRDFCDGRFSVLIGTTVIGEGVDVPRASALIYASGGDASVGLMQSYFRPLTAAAGKTFGRIYDFVDRHNPQLYRHSLSRLSFVRERFGIGRVAVY